MLEKILEILSPDECLKCRKEGECLCIDCQKSQLIPKKQACVLCNQINSKGKTCPGCYQKSMLSGANIAFRYEGAIKDVIRGLKYENKRSYARFLARQLPAISADFACFVPSDGRTRRSRGYDQSELIAKHYANANNIYFKKAMLRRAHTKQVGLNRTQRIENIKGDFVINSDVKGKSVLIIDDVITTGATVSECAMILKQAGAKKVWALALAKS